MRLAPLAAVAVLLAGCATAPSSQQSVSVQGAPAKTAGVSTIEQALREAGVTIPPGRLFSIRTRTPLGPDLRPGKVLVDGLPTSIAAELPPGAVIRVEPGGDAYEPVETVTVPLPANNGWATLRVAAKPGTMRVVRGAVSHEVVSRKVLTRPQDGRLPSPRPVALTFDDGPDPRWTPAVLQLLARWHVKATFCLVGREVAKHPHLVRAIAAQGHALCNHTYHHDEHLAQRTPAQVVADMKRTSDLITKASGGVRPTFFRAPGGSWSPVVDLQAHKLGMSPLHWNVDPSDWRRPGALPIVHRVLGQVKPGAIILLHDGGGKRDQSVTALRFVLWELARRHYTFAVPHA